METFVENCVNSGEVSPEIILSEGLEITNYSGYYIFKDGFVLSLKGKKPRVLKSAKCGENKKYDFVVLSEGGITSSFYIHRLVAEYFVHNDSPDTKIEVNHLDGDTNNNASTNLEWVTPKENSNHAVDSGLTLTGESCPWAKVTESFVREICELLQEGKSSGEVRAITGIDSARLCRIKTRKQWKQISCEYNF